VQFKKEHTVLIITAVVTAFALIGESLIDSMVFHTGPFLEILIGQTRHDLLLRVFMSSGFLAFGIYISIMLSRHRRAEDALKWQAAAIETSIDGIAIYNREGEYIYVNQAYASQNGYESAAELIGNHMKNSYEENEYLRIQQTCFPLLQKNGRWRGELIAKRKNGSTYFQEASVTLFEDGSRVCISHDITWRKRSEERVRRSERFLNMIFNSIRDPFCIFDSEFRIIRANTAYGDLKGKAVSDLIARKCYEVLEGQDHACAQCVVEKSLHSGDPCAKEKEIILEDGSAVWMEIYTYPILDEEGRVTHIIEYTRDATARKKSETEKIQLIAKLEHLSRTDGLTGLMNRRALTDSLVYELDRAKRYKTDLSIVLCDVDNFKDINDNFGHAAGDRALQALSGTFMTLLRKTDLAGRYGGDEFMIVLPATSLKGAERLADKLLAIVRNTDVPVRVDQTAHLSLSIGVTGLQQSDQDIEALIKRADEAMYAAKQAGRNRVFCGSWTS
jgi:diguanylate cyclase (GGDEF)-like protein/PAS domain S-box-containing protein